MDRNVVSLPQSIEQLFLRIHLNSHLSQKRSISINRKFVTRLNYIVKLFTTIGIEPRAKKRSYTDSRKRIRIRAFPLIHRDLCIFLTNHPLRI
jgi:hypothetical protein